MKTWCDDDSFDADPVDHACACGTSADEPHAPGCEAPTAWSRDVVLAVEPRDNSYAWPLTATSATSASAKRPMGAPMTRGGSMKPRAPLRPSSSA